ncbi:MAG: hypothetical protein ACREID_00005, partial [Planctomycetota bacterium]
MQAQSILSPMRFAKLALLAGVCAAADIETIEETTESFANALYEFSDAARRGDEAAVRAFFANGLQGARFPATEGTLGPPMKWLRKRNWRFDAGPGDPAASLIRFLRLHHSLEEVRFKVKSSSLEG